MILSCLKFVHSRLNVSWNWDPLDQAMFSNSLFSNFSVPVSRPSTVKFNLMWWYSAYMVIMSVYLYYCFLLVISPVTPFFTRDICLSDACFIELSSIKPRVGCKRKFQWASSFRNTQISLVGSDKHTLPKSFSNPFLFHSDAWFELHQVVYISAFQLGLNDLGK